MITTTTGINVETFRALPTAEKAACWRSYTAETKFELCRETLKLMGREHTSDKVEAAVAHWDAKWSTVDGQPVAPAYTISHRIAYDATTRDYACYVQVGGDPEQYIGSAGTYHESELKCCDYRNDLMDLALGILDSRPIPRCGDCKAVLADTGRCEDCDDRANPIRHIVFCDTCARDAALRGSLGRRVSDAQIGSCACCQVDRQIGRLYELKDRLPAWVHTPSLETVRL